MFQTKLANKSPYTATNRKMGLKLAELQESDEEIQRLKAIVELKKGLNEYVDVDGVLHHQELPFVPKIFLIKLISRHQNNLLAGYFGINKTRKLIGRKYF